MPDWLIAECGLPTDATINTLGPAFWKWHSRIPPRLQHFVEFLIKSRVKSIESVRLYEQPWPVGLEISDIPFSTRAANALNSSSLFANKEALTGVTFGQLLRIPNVGVRSLLEIAGLTEAALDMHWRATAELAKSFAVPCEHGVGEGSEVKSMTDSMTSATSVSIDDWRRVLTDALREPWIDQIDEHDPRFRALLPPGHGTLEERIDRAVSDPAASSTEIPAMIESLPRVRAAVVHMAGQPLEDNLLELLAMYIGREEPRFSAMAARFGWLGADPRTLQECGNILGVTRERIRQIEAKFIRRLTRHSIYLPSIDSALLILEGAAPTPVSRAANLLVERGVCRKPFSPRSLIETAKLFGRKTGLAVEEHRGERILVSGDQGQALGILYRTARKLAGQSGVTSVYTLVDTIIQLLAPIEPADIDEDKVRRLLKEQLECEFLNEDWFWFPGIPEGRNRLENVVKKILSVASPQSIASIREGVRRSFRWRASSHQRYRSLTLPPQAVLAHFLQRHPDFHVDGDQVSSVRPLDYRKLLREGEQTIVDVLRGVSSGVLDRKTLVNECLARGINDNTLAIYTTYSPILEHLGLSLWKLRGVRVDPAAVEAVREQNALRPRETRVQDFGWTTDGKLWVKWTVPSITAAPVLGIPAAIKRYLCGQSFEARPREIERPVGKISITDGGTSYGYAPFLRHSGADEGDSLRAEFDLSKLTVQLSIDEDELED